MDGEDLAWEGQELVWMGFVPGGRLVWTALGGMDAYVGGCGWGLVNAEGG